MLLFLRSSYHYLFKNIAHVRSICNFHLNCMCVFVYFYLCIWMSDTWKHCFWDPRTITFFKNIAYVRSICKFDQSCICLLVYLCICIFVYLCIYVFVYLHIRYSWTLFLRSSYRNLFKNIVHVMPMFNFNQNCICVFVYLCICIWVTSEWWWGSWKWKS